MSTTGPWYISVRAVQDYLALCHRPAVTDGPAFDRASGELIAIAEATVASGRIPTTTDTGALRYRGPKPLRCQLLVMPSLVAGRLPQLVRVLPSHGGA